MGSSIIDYSIMLSPKYGRQFLADLKNAWQNEKKKKSIHSVCRESENYIFGNLTEDTFRKKSKFFVKCYHGHIILASLSYFWFLNLLCLRLVKIKHCQIHSLRSNKHSGRLLISDVHMVIDSCLASWLLESFSWLCG